MYCIDVGTAITVLLIQTMLNTYDIEQAITRLRGIISCRVIANGNALAEIHILAGTGRPAKQLARDVETALKVQFELVVDHRIISIVQLDDAEDYVPPPVRPRFSSLRVETVEGKVTVEVALDVAGHRIEGKAEGIGNRTRLAADAAIDAVQNLYPPGSFLVLENIAEIVLGGRPACVVAISIYAGGTTERQVGAALMGTDPLESAVKAVLMALNRRLRLWTEIASERTSQENLG